MSRAPIRRAIWGGVLFVLAAAVAAADQRPAPTQTRYEQRGETRGGPTQGPPQRYKWWQDEKVKAELKLAPEQSARIEEIFQANFAKMKDVVDELNRREEQLSNLISGPDVTESELLKQTDQVESLRGTLSKARTLMLFRMRRVLTAEQRSKLVEIQKAQERERRNRSPQHGQPGH